MGSSKSKPIVVQNTTNEEVQITFFYETLDEKNLIAIGPRQSACLDTKGSKVTVNVVTNDAESGKIKVVATYTVQMNCKDYYRDMTLVRSAFGPGYEYLATDEYQSETNTWMNLKVIKKCNNKYFDLRRVADNNHDHFHHKMYRFESPNLYFYSCYSQVYNNTPFSIKILIVDSSNRTTSQVIEPQESCVVATPEGMNTVQIVELESNDLVASRQEQAKPRYLDINKWHTEKRYFPNMSTMIAEYTGNHFTLVQGVLRYSFCTSKWYPVALLDTPYDHRQEYLRFEADLEYCKKCSCKHASRYKLEPPLIW